MGDGRPPRGLGEAARTMRATAAGVGPGAVRGAWWGDGCTMRATAAAAAVGPGGEGGGDKLGWGQMGIFDTAPTY